jgi:hypothetical protein
MQKLTVFSAILSLSIILVIGDLVSHDYLEDETSLPNVEELLEEVEEIEESPELIPEETIDSSIETSEETLPVEVPTETPIEEPDLLEEVVDLSSETTDLNVLVPILSESLLLESGFFDPVLKDTIFSGYVFQFLPFADADAFVYQWNLFDGESFVGSIYEIKYPNETASFQGYLALRQAASDQSTGTVNEVNNYKDASFYFNHETKSQTVHLVIRSGKNVYAFEYAHRDHDSMKLLFDLLP